ncbi:plasmid partitioning protein RepB [Rhodobacteraceae bacterium RKSG542]|uniref:plasmid partitioning protein RepB n=1 Tax=Pseudovibrio flavus TaxID=2529854 RepID=UPI0012BC7885|nr:plasmid partitioning protein RepB [Pseudovibrio flavus]MTI15747.1 plasmid partitioning protein RepB [Pseudovibrio flavus]
MTKAKDRKHALDSLFGGGMANMVQQGVAPRPRLSSGAIGAAEINLIKDERDTLRSQVDDLTTRLSSSINVVELDTACVQPSFVADRMVVEHDPDFEALKASIEETGQQVPILVRPSKDSEGHYQIAYGHRRWRACKALGIAVRGVIKDLTDEDLLIAQGQENHERKNLSFIETCLFVYRLSKDYPQTLICRAIGKDKSLVSKYRKIGAMMPEDLLEAIGPAPKIGRPRWEEMQQYFEEGVVKEKYSSILSEVLASSDFKNAFSDERFTIVLAALQPKDDEAESAVDTEIEVAKADDKPERKSAEYEWIGREQVRVQRKGSAFNLVIDEKKHPGLAGFVMARLESVLEEFEESTKGANS